MNHPIIAELNHREYLKKRLEEDFPDIDDETLSDTLDGLNNLKEELAAIVRSQQDDRVLSGALKQRIQEMQERQRRFEHRISQKKELVTSVMERAGLKSIVAEDFTASVRSTPAQLIVVEEDAIPESYWKPQPSKLDRSKLLNALKAEKEIPGAQLGNGSVTLSVRTK